MQKFNLLKYAGVACLLLLSIAGLAQDPVEVDTGEIGSWFERNWIWVAAGILLIILIAALSRGSRRRNTIEGGRRRTTTVVEDAAGNTKSVTTTEENL